MTDTRRPPHVPPTYQNPYSGAPYYQAPQQQPAPKQRRRWPWVVGGLFLVLLVIGAATGSHTATTSTSTTSSGGAAVDAPAPAQKPSGPATTVSDGTYQVGVDVAPGRYKTPGPGTGSIINDCYWSRNKNDSGQFNAIIANGNAQGPGSVTIKQGEFFETSGGCTWTKQ